MGCLNIFCRRYNEYEAQEKEIPPGAMRALRADVSQLQCPEDTQQDASLFRRDEDASAGPHTGRNEARLDIQGKEQDNCQLSLAIA